MPWRTAEDGVWGHGSRTEGMVFVHQVKSDVYRGKREGGGGASKRDISGSWEWVSKQWQASPDDQHG
jgi:hypothetical protein